MNLPWLKQLLVNKVIPCNVEGVTTATCKCKACALGKEVHTSEGNNKVTICEDKHGELQHSTRPGATISTDQFVSSLKGRLLHTFSKEAKTNKFSGGTIYIDKTTGYLFIKN